MLLMFKPAAAGAAIANVQGKGTSANVSNSLSLTLDAPVATGNSVIVSCDVYAYSNGAATCTDNKGNTYTRAVYGSGGGGGTNYGNDYIFYCIKPNNAPQTITISFSGGGYPSLCVDEYSGVGAFFGSASYNNGGGVGVGGNLYSGITAATPVNGCLQVANIVVGGGINLSPAAPFANTKGSLGQIYSSGIFPVWAVQAAAGAAGGYIWTVTSGAAGAATGMIAVFTPG